MTPPFSMLKWMTFHRQSPFWTRESSTSCTDTFIPSGGLPPACSEACSVNVLAQLWDSNAKYADKVTGLPIQNLAGRCSECWDRSAGH